MLASGTCRPPEADDVEPAHARAVSLDDDERRHVALARGRSRDEGALADAHVLRDAAETTERDPVLDDGMTRELRGVGEHAVRADDDVVRDVGAHHEQVVRADARGAPVRPAVNGRVLAEHVALADLESRGPPGVLLGLRLAADDRERMDDAVRPEHGWPAHDGVRVKDAPSPEDDARLDDRVGTDDDVLPELGASVDDCGRRARGMSRRHRARSTTLARSSALAQSVPSTAASPWNFQTLVRWCAIVTSRSSRSPGRDRTPELRLVDSEEVHQRARGVERLGRVGEDAADLRERLEDEHSGHDRPRREVPLKPRLSHRHALVADDPLARHHLRHTVHQHERPPLRQDLQDAVDFDRRAAFTRHPSDRASCHAERGRGA